MKYSYESISISPMPFLRKRDIKVYLPINYHQTKRLFPVIYLHDGEKFMASAEIFDDQQWNIQPFLEQNGEFIIVSIASVPEYQLSEYAPFPIEEDALHFLNNQNIPIQQHRPEGAGYIAWIVQELKPFIDKHYQSNPHKSGLAGINMGAVVSLYAQLKYPDIFLFSGILAPSYWFSPENLKNFIKRSSMTPKNSIYTYEDFHSATHGSHRKYFLEISDLLQFKTPSKIHIDQHSSREYHTHNIPNYFIQSMFHHFKTTL
ncbi:alpha/beta hydrolase-fold protein [Entomospira entomophila]|uniref:Alpha/beta hydrolase n=1 Tax=Entomospira entomophila TaxID=2719988 RepID=A0A968GCF7_9SPIO|nr:alpha/beta hydrolase-fold protein [Entomospira entomophilus]NIZ40389.1 alpha/beta hydrolase [Entomospira entomophilus]WDI35948.1 alpha/beta hydrolase-fold protein [Entomospira entomophilus]